MSRSTGDRQEDIREALKLAARQIGDSVVNTTYIDASRPPLDEIDPVTWDLLQHLRYVEPAACEHLYFLTPLGWLKAEKMNPALLEKHCTSLCRCLKKYVKGRRVAVVVEVGCIAPQSGLSEAWVCNAIHSCLLERHFKIVGVEWQRVHESVRVPVSFGIQLRSLR